MVMPFSSLTWLAPWLQTLFLIAYVLIASVVTVHALLRKRDVRAALGWIGLAWLSPILGGGIYYIFGINRVTRRALRIAKRDSVPSVPLAPVVPPNLSRHMAVLAAIGQQVTGGELTGGNRIALFKGGDEAYPAMLAAIGQARHSVALASYIFRDDAAGHSFVAALVAAQARGVAVRVLLDSVGSGYVYSGAMRHLAAGGVKAARFLHTWVPWRMPFLNMRNHKKILIVDGRIGFTGGLNIGAENSARLGRKHRVDDLHARIDGPAVRQLMETFANDWSFTTDEELGSEIWWPELEAAGTVFVRGVRSGPDSDIGKLSIVLGAALEQAETRVRIVTPYFLPDDRLLFDIAQAQLRGVEVEIVIPESCDYRLLDWAMRAHLRFFPGAPRGLYMSPLPFDHSKLMTVDGQWALLGSSNWDTRSLRLNFEFDLECYDIGLTAEIDALIDAKIARSKKIDRNALLRAPRWRQLRDAAIRLFQPYL